MSLVALLAAAAIAATPTPAPKAAAVVAQPAIGHVFTIILENKNEAKTFAADSAAPYLAKTLRAQGALLSEYYGTGHNSLDNYISIVSGQAPNAITQADCQLYQEFIGALGSDGQATGQGCIYPSDVKTVADQIVAKKLTYRGYMQDMGADPARENATCAHPAINGQDHTQGATAKDQYATRHNPFVYFHSIIDHQADCDRDIVNLDRLSDDLASVKTTKNYSFITPDLCGDGHDATCADPKQKGGYAGINDFLTTWVPQITGSPAFQKDGLLVITFDESENDDTSCCGEQNGPNTPSPGINGPGGGKVGALLISPFIKPGTVSTQPMNHYGYLRSIEDIFGLGHLGYAGQAGLNTFTSMGLFHAAPATVPKPVQRFTVKRRHKRIVIRLKLAAGVVGHLTIKRHGHVLKRFTTGASATYRIKVGRRARVILRASRDGKTVKTITKRR